MRYRVLPHQLNDVSGLRIIRFEELAAHGAELKLRYLHARPEACLLLGDARFAGIYQDFAPSLCFFRTRS